MPELPEVEVTRRGIIPLLVGHTVTQVTVRTPKLRYPIPEALAQLLCGHCLQAIERRAKYLLLRFHHGTLLIHLGMSGSLRVLTPPEGSATAFRKHEHLELAFGTRCLRLNDPRRFGAVLWWPQEEDGKNAASHPYGSEPPLLAGLGLEPLDEGFTGAWLHQATRGSSSAIKPWLMDHHRVVGIGNIYASESLFRAAIDPRCPAGRLGPQRCTRLVQEIRATLNEAIAAGGSSLRDFTQADGHAGYFQQHYFVYGRTGQPCRHCARPIRTLRQGLRASFYCPHCQHR